MYEYLRSKGHNFRPIFFNLGLNNIFLQYIGQVCEPKESNNVNSDFVGCFPPNVFGATNGAIPETNPLPSVYNMVG